MTQRKKPIKSQMKASRYNKDKSRFDLVPMDALDALAKHYGIGAKKYPARNWEKGLLWNEGCMASLLRHVSSWSQGEDIDKENNQHHDVAIAWNAMALITHRLRNIGIDDRAKTKKKPR